METVMPEIITYNPGDKFVLVDSVGKVDTTEWKTSVERVSALKKQYGVSAALIDVTKQTKTSSLTDITEFVAFLDRGIRYALLVEDVSPHSSETTEPKQRFLEVYAANEGYKIKSFISKDEAEAWLLS